MPLVQIALPIYRRRAKQGRAVVSGNSLLLELRCVLIASKGRVPTAPDCAKIVPQGHSNLRVVVLARTVPSVGTAPLGLPHAKIVLQVHILSRDRQLARLVQAARILYQLQASAALQANTLPRPRQHVLLAEQELTLLVQISHVLIVLRVCTVLPLELAHVLRVLQVKLVLRQV